jgi:hypothetical protein
MSLILKLFASDIIFANHKWSFRRSAASITDMNAGQPNVPGSVLFYT